MTCGKCGELVEIGEWPFCPHGIGFASVIGDEIPGGMVVENMGPTPMRFDSKTAWKREMAARGLINRVEHKPLPGTDKSPHTQRWV